MKPKYTASEIVDQLKQIKAFVIDQDGTAYLERQTFPWTVPFLNGLKKHDLKYLFLSNNSSKSREEHRQKLASLGIKITTDQILSSGDATIEYLLAQPNSRNIYLLGTPTVEADFLQAGFNIHSNQPKYVVLAYDLTLTFDKLDRACHFIRNGATFIATHEDNNWMISPTEHRPDVGALAAAITTATKIKPKFIGKPNPEMVQAFLNRLKVTADEVAIIGDRLNIDIRMGQDFDILSFCVLSGKTKAADIPDSPFQPGFVIDRTIDILDYLGCET